MRLHAYFTQALPPNTSERLALTQLPGVNADNLDELPDAKTLDDVLYTLEDKKDPRVPDIKKTLAKWGKVDLVSASFQGALFLLNLQVMAYLTCYALRL